MSSKIVTIAHELADRAVNALDDEGWHELANELAVAIAAPVVERQPTGQWRIPVNGDWFYGTHAQCVREREEYESTYTDLDREEAGVVVPEQIYSGAPPELAELQATIDRLRAENERLQEAHEQVCTNYNKVSYASEERWQIIAQLQDEIERLKGGQGEAVAWGTMQPEFSDDDRTLITDKEYAEVYNRQCYTLTPLFASPPAPVSVVLPTDDDAEIAFEHSKFHGHDVFFAGFQAAIDKVKELNQ